MIHDYIEGEVDKIGKVNNRGKANELKTKLFGMIFNKDIQNIDYIQNGLSNQEK